MNHANLRVLIVDDMNTMRKLVAKALRDMGITNIVEGADGAQGWQAFSTATPAFDLVISDWNMPNCTGLDFLKRVRADGRFKTSPFILLTAEAETAQVEDALKAGVSGYVIKPFSPENLRQKIEHVMSKSAKPAA